MLHAFSVDVEQGEGLSSRVVDATKLIPRLPARRDVRATFSALGWVAERQPELVRAIAGAGLGARRTETVRLSATRAFPVGGGCGAAHQPGG